MNKWDDLQNYYDDNHTAKKTYTYFGISQRQFYKAVKNKWNTKKVFI
jgi:hypothetical protein